ncbi:hypothetical protein BDV95DRAFT_668358 [Massariosphaeria phaeospora]|uniref:Uncharacterized protein n=1 Tax=Massariosphaeria phaeospora TaxID=100035 RepID=A0A7C8MA59_9PLEO|nr:hypothetical protein BDV95DRAFT_668358 [Massariosphaeria phaeospora]
MRYTNSMFASISKRPRKTPTPFKQGINPPNTKRAKVANRQGKQPTQDSTESPAPAQRRPLGEISGNTRSQPSAAAKSGLFIPEYDDDEPPSEPPSDPALKFELAEDIEEGAEYEVAEIAGATETASQVLLSQAGLTQAFEPGDHSSVSPYEGSVNVNVDVR